LLLGLALLAAELLSPSFGVLGAGGLAAFIAGCILLFDSDIPGFGVPLALILALAASSALLVFLAGGMALRARKRRVVSGAEDMIGMTGEVLAFDGTDTWAEVNGERWKVRSAQPLAVGQRVRVRAVNGLTLDVAPDPAPPISSRGE
jgi:membrane-bound serine protease (ClpP class)